MCRPAEVHPDAVVQVEHVHARHLAVHVGQVGPHARDVAVDLRLLRDRLVADLVLAGMTLNGPISYLSRLAPFGASWWSRCSSPVSMRVPLDGAPALAGAAEHAASMAADGQPP